MIDHLQIQVADVGASARFYDTVLETLSLSRVLEFDDAAIGYGVPGQPQFWIGPQQTGTGFRETHIAFQAADHAAVERFFHAAEGLGAEILYKPRRWPEYHPDYFAVFVRDPDGNNVEAVCHRPEASG
ncbi:MAG TPA: VOC family protein [Jatrophihabitans sp.]|nr:VOC family protein [Jatrophihabitans sp.]